MKAFPAFVRRPDSRCQADEQAGGQQGQLNRVGSGDWYHGIEPRGQKNEDVDG